MTYFRNESDEFTYSKVFQSTETLRDLINFGFSQGLTRKVMVHFPSSLLSLLIRRHI